jgi:hypothetical protein
VSMQGMATVWERADAVGEVDACMNGVV